MGEDDDFICELEAGGEVDRLSSDIYELKHKIAAEHVGRECDTEDYPDLYTLTALYEQYTRAFSYKIFLYGVFLNLFATENIKDLFESDKQTIAKKIKLIAESIDKEQERNLKARFSKTILLKEYKEEWEKIKKWKEEEQKLKNKKSICKEKSLLQKIKSFLFDEN